MIVVKTLVKQRIAYRFFLYFLVLLWVGIHEAERETRHLKRQMLAITTIMMSINGYNGSDA